MATGAGVRDLGCAQRAEGQVVSAAATILSMWLMCPVEAPRYRVDVSRDLITWEQVNVIACNATLVVECERVERRFWRIVPLLAP